MATPHHLRLLGRTFSGFEQALSRQVSAFHSHRPDIEVQLDFLEPQELYALAFDQGSLADGSIDVALLLTDWLPEAISRELILPLDSFFAHASPDGWPEGWSPSLRQLQCDIQGQTYALPYHDGPMVLIYRKDLLTDEAERAAFFHQYKRELRVPKTWQEYVDIARFFTRPERDLYGTVAAGLNDAHNNVYDFLIHLWSRGGQLQEPDGRLTVDTPIGREALQFHIDLFNRYSVTPPEAKRLDSVAAGAYYASGHAAMTVNWCGFATMAELPAASQIVGRSATALVPRGDYPQGAHVSINVYWVLAIARGCSRPDLAYEMLRWIARPDMDQITAQEGCIATRYSTWRDPKTLTQFPVYATIEAVHRRVHSPPPLLTWPAVTEVLNQAIDDALYERQSVPVALRWAQREIDRLTRPR